MLAENVWESIDTCLASAAYSRSVFFRSPPNLRPAFPVPP
jgi:hypothetical protein